MQQQSPVKIHSEPYLCSYASNKNHPSSGCEPDGRRGSYVEEDTEFNFLKVPKLPRSSSLRSKKKTPPGTPTTQGKSVRFADALGLDLELVRHIQNADEPPTLNFVRFPRQDFTSTTPLVVTSHWQVCFPQPIGVENFMEQVLEKKVMLENCIVTNASHSISGVVRVANMSYKKDVWIRYSVNGWLTYEEIQAAYVDHSNDVSTDRFSFDLRIPDDLGTRSRLEFAVRFSAEHETFWDSNNGKNYALECVG